MNKVIVSIVIVSIALLGGLVFFANNSYKNDPKTKLTNSFQGTDTEIVSDKGLHIHTAVSILVNGQKQEIPANLGIISGRLMGDIHTHDTTGEIHWEMNTGPVKKGHLKLARLFELWGKPFNATQILDAKNGSGKTVKMTINGQSNTEFENYVIKDKDKIEIIFE